MDYSIFENILNTSESDVLLLVTSVQNNNNNSHMIAALKNNIEVTSNYVKINNSTNEKHIVYYVPYTSILEVIEC